jgi:hypothetical protein
MLPFTFRAADAPLQGSFALDTSATWGTATGSGGTSAEDRYGVLYSPSQIVSGTFNGISFSGQATLYTFDQPTYYSNGVEALAQDYWILRGSQITSPSFSGKSINVLTLAFYYSPRADVHMSLTPPPQPEGSCCGTGWAVGFSDGTYASGGGLMALAVASPAPEPETYVMMLLGMITVVGLAIRRRPRSAALRRD